MCGFGCVWVGERVGESITNSDKRLLEAVTLSFCFSTGHRVLFDVGWCMDLVGWLRGCDG